MNPFVDLFRGILRTVWKHRWTFLVPVATFVLPATLISLNLPDTFRAPARIRVRVVNPEHIGRGLPQERAAMPEEQLATVRERLTARVPVEAAAPILFPDASPADPLTLQQVRGVFDYEQIGSSAFSVSLTGVSAEQAAGATNALVRAFLESERADRLRRAENNSEFHKGELEVARKSYRKLTATMDEFRRARAASLPERKDVIRDEMARIGTDITSQDTWIVGARQRIQALDDQLSALEATLPRDLSTKVGAAEEALRLQLAEAQAALHDAQKELAERRARYTEEHPDVVHLRSAVEVHRKSVDETIKALERVRKQAAGEAGRTAKRILDSRRKNLAALRAMAVADVERAEKRKAALRQRQTELQTQLAAIPATEAALRPLQRELAEADKVLESRQRDADSARAAVEFYRTADLSDVTGYGVDTWAVPPTWPTGPERWRFAATAILLGLLVGYGLVLLRRRVEGTRVETVEDAAKVFPTAVVVGMPNLAAGRPDKGRRWPVLDLGLAVYVLLCLGLSVIAVASHKGWTGAPEWLRNLLLG